MVGAWPLEECVQEAMGGEEAETCQKRQLASQGVLTAKEGAEVGSWADGAWELVILKRRNFAICFHVDGRAPWAGEGGGTNDAGTGGDTCSSKILGTCEGNR